MEGKLAVSERQLVNFWEKKQMTLVLYPELFWSWCTGLGSQTQTPKCSKVLISGVSFCQHSLLQSQESDVLSYSECKIAKNFQGFTPGPHWGGLIALPQTPWLHNGFSHCYASQKTGTPQKLLDMALDLEEYSQRPCLIDPGVKKEKKKGNMGRTWQKPSLINWNTQRRTENQCRQTAQNRTLSTQYQYTTCDC